MYRDPDLLPCPRCGSKYVEISTSRDLNVLDTYVHCMSCDLSTFNVESIAFVTNRFDSGELRFKYNRWVETNPTRYRDEYWEENNGSN